ncbi:hypothetical protein ACIQU6_44335 [Streptomyces sp. NPDC090442]|uniref:hypothetical protein n=1 Tax=Streptomyces sp. NPDC090442 TaxID=3365962 RepID=UPI0038241988
MVNTPTNQPRHGPVAHLPNTPPGLTARFVQRTRRQQDRPLRSARTRRTRLRDTHVDLQSNTPPDPAVFDRLLASCRHGDRNFILGASSRIWTTVKTRFGDEAWPFTIDLIRTGIITLRCEVTGDLTLGTPTRWSLTAAGRGHARLHQEARDAQNQRLTHALERARAGIGNLPTPPEGIAQDDLERLDEALTREMDRPVPAHKRIALLTALADDLCHGTRHTSTRAFSLAHTRDTKTWDDALGRVQFVV